MGLPYIPLNSWNTIRTHTVQRISKTRYCIGRPQEIHPYLSILDTVGSLHIAYIPVYIFVFILLLPIVHICTVCRYNYFTHLLEYIYTNNNMHIIQRYNHCLLDVHHTPTLLQGGRVKEVNSPYSRFGFGFWEERDNSTSSRKRRQCLK